MTGIVCYLTYDECHIFTDRAYYDQEGVVCGFIRKAIPVHDHPIVLAGRGNLAITSQIVQEILDATSELSTMNTQAAIDTIQEYFEGSVSGRGTAEAEFLICSVVDGWPSIHFVNLHGRNNSIPPCHLHEPVRMPDQGEYASVYLGPEVSLPAHHQYLIRMPDYAALGTEVLEHMRRTCAPTFDFNNIRKVSDHCIYGIGGGIDHTVVKKSGTQCCTILIWPDKIGRKIEPESASEAL